MEAAHGLAGLFTAVQAAYEQFFAFLQHLNDFTAVQAAYENIFPVTCYPVFFTAVQAAYEDASLI